MRNVIVIYTNCNNPKAKGDFGAAGKIAKDVADHLRFSGIDNVDVILTSTRAGNGFSRFCEMYGVPDKQRKITIDGTQIELRPVEEISKPYFNVVGYIESAYCRPCPNEYIQKFINVNTKATIVGTQNYPHDTEQEQWSYCYTAATSAQPCLKKTFAEGHMHYVVTGVSEGRCGLPVLKTDFSKIDKPKISYGMIYYFPDSHILNSEYIRQYMALSGQENFLMLNNMGDSMRFMEGMVPSAMPAKVSYSVKDLGAPKTDKAPLVIKSSALKHEDMLYYMAHAAPMVALTGSQSVVEAMSLGHIVFYQYADNNKGFVEDMSRAISETMKKDKSISATRRQDIENMFDLLMGPKPLNPELMSLLRKTIHADPTLLTTLSEVQKKVLNTKAGKIAPGIIKWFSQSTIDSDKRAARMEFARRFEMPPSGINSSRLMRLREALYSKKDTALPSLSVTLRRAAAISDKATADDLSYIIDHCSTKELNYACSRGLTALHWAVKVGRLDKVKLLVKSGVDVLVEDATGKTAMDYAGEESEIRDYLKPHVDEARIKQIQKGKKSEGKMHAASKSSPHGFFKRQPSSSDQVRDSLLAQFKKPGEKENPTIGQALRRGATGKFGNMRAFKDLLAMAAKFDVNSKDPKKGLTPLHWAIYSNQVRKAELLLKAGADLRARSEAGQTPYDFAKSSSEEVLDMVEKYYYPSFEQVVSRI